MGQGGSGLRTSAAGLGGSGGGFFSRADPLAVGSTSHLHGGLGLGLGGSSGGLPTLSPLGVASSSLSSPYFFENRPLRGSGSSTSEEFIPKTYNDNKRSAPMAGESFFHGMPAERDTYGGGLYNGASGGSGYGDSRPYDPYLDTTKERLMIRGERLPSSSTSSSSMRDSDLGSFTPREKDRRKEREQGRVSREDKEMMRLRRDKDPLASSSLSSLSSSSSSSSSALPLQDDTGRQDARDKNESREDSTSRDPRKSALGPTGGGDESLRNSTDLALRADRVQAGEGPSAYESTKPLSASGSALSRDRYATCRSMNCSCFCDTHVIGL